MGYNAAGDWVPDEDLTNIATGNSKSPTNSIDTQIADTEKEIARLKESLRIANQSLKNIDPKYEMNQPYIKKLNSQIVTDQTALDSLQGKLDSLKKQKESATAKPSKSTVTKQQQPPSDAGEVVVTAKKLPTSSGKRTYNPLGKFSSYTYRLSMYMISPTAVQLHNETGVWPKSSMYLVAQSAGTDSQRAPGFELDYYIDNLDIETTFSPSESGFSGVSTGLTFDIFEPYGMTFPTRLIQAASIVGNANTSGSPGLETAMSQFYLMVIRFYGYDEKGEPVTAPASALGTSNKTDDPGLFERTFPFAITEMRSKLDNKMVKYSFTTMPINDLVASSQHTGGIKEALNISGETVGDILVDSPTSLVKILNAKEEELVKKKKKSVANKYNIVFEDFSGIEDARLVDKNHYVPSQTPLTNLPGPVNVREASGGKAATVNKNKRAIQIPAGSRIYQAIEQVVSQSTYISDCLSVINKEETQPVTEGADNTTENAAPKEFAWFIAVPQIKYIDRDEQLKINAYEITYYVKKYRVPFFRSPYFPNRSGYDGPDKIFNYWYTGKNEGVLSYDIVFNGLYSGLGSVYGSGKLENKGSAPVYPSTSAGEDTAGKTPGTSEETASFKSWMFSPEEQMKANLKILGDPDFLVTSSFGSFDEMSSKSPGEEAPVNPLNGQIFIEIDVRQVEDFSENGTMKPESNLRFWQFSDEMEKKLNGRMLYSITSIKSKFVRGQFTQDLTDLILPDTTMGASTQASGAEREQTQQKKFPNVAGGGRGKQGGPTAEQIKQAKQTAEDENSFASNNGGQKNSDVDPSRPFVGYRKIRRTNKQNLTGG